MVFVFIRSFYFQYVVLTSTNNMHNKMAEKVIRATILFFDSNPQGRISTRFQKDMTIMDVAMAPIAVMVTQGVMRTITVIITVAIVSPYILIVAVPGLIYMRWVYKTGVGPMIESQRFD
jgi:ABC-type multidrug transport system fused ATPase/permease subunit